MSWDNKVVWSEGMFLRPQHFQQFDRYVERLVRGRVAGTRPHAWGLTELKINRELLSIGKFAVASCRGVLEDGTPFNIPEDAEHPDAIDIPEDCRNAIIYLTLPVRHPGGAEADHPDNEESIARYGIHEYETGDSTAGSEALATLTVGKLRLKFLREDEERAGFVCLGLARIVEVRTDKQVVLDDRYIPPCLISAASPALTGFMAELRGLINHRGQALAGRVSESGTKGAAEIADFLLLQAVNRYQPLIAHLATSDEVHPETFYSLAVQVAGELATFASKTKRPPEFPPYQHDDLQKTFTPVMNELRQLLSAVLEQSAIPIPLQLRKYGISVAPIMDRSLISTASFVLAIRADIPTETIRRNFPNHVKIGPVEQIRELVNVALPGIAVRPLPVAPRQIPYHAGVTYFELDKTSSYWKQLETSGGFAIHVAGDFQKVEMEFWAIKG